MKKMSDLTMLTVLNLLALSAMEARGETIRADVTAYCDRARPMADGHKVHVGACAGPRWIPLGTIVLIAGKRYVVEDRLNRRYPTRFDVWLPTTAACRAWGKRRLTVTIPAGLRGTSI